MATRARVGPVPLLLIWGLLLAPASSPAAEEPPASSQETPLPPTEDPVLKEQIVRIHSILAELDFQTSKRRKAIQEEADPARKANLRAQLDGLRRERGLLVGLLNDLIAEARATEWTRIDEALKRVRSFEQTQERLYKREEDLRERTE